ncbi:MAG: hypothetical protein GC160_02810 [Acidobacteria bacterium]|nr:hypothetical protein [Acidobacteriota bacterium]
MKEDRVFRNEEPPPLFRAEQGPARLPLSGAEGAVGMILRRHRGRMNPVSRRAIEKATGLSERDVKAAIASLAADHDWRIGRLRGSPGGYFIVETQEDAEAAWTGYERQMVTMARRLRAALPRARRLEFAGQLRVALLEEGESDA